MFLWCLQKYVYSRTLQEICETKKIIIINHKNANEILEKSEKEKPENVFFSTHSYCQSMDTCTECDHFTGVARTPANT